jgi:hypothetical protein
MKKKNYKDQEHFLDKNSRLDSTEYPELWEQHKRIKFGFFHANITSQLRSRAVKLYDIILYCTNKRQSTYARNPKLSKLSGISEDWIGKKKKSYLNELEYWHLIKRSSEPNRWDRRKKDRTIVCLRWDTAEKILLEEGKITKEGIVGPNPFAGLKKKRE